MLPLEVPSHVSPRNCYPELTQELMNKGPLENTKEYHLTNGTTRAKGQHEQRTITTLDNINKVNKKNRNTSLGASKGSTIIIMFYGQIAIWQSSHVYSILKLPNCYRAKFYYCRKEKLTKCVPVHADNLVFHVA